VRDIPYGLATVKEASGVREWPKLMANAKPLPAEPPPLHAASIPSSTRGRMTRVVKVQGRMVPPAEWMVI